MTSVNSFKWCLSEDLVNTFNNYMKTGLLFKQYLTEKKQITGIMIAVAIIVCMPNFNVACNSGEMTKCSCLVTFF